MVLTIGHTFHAKTLGLSYPNMLKAIWESGNVVDSRAGRTRELLNASLQLDIPKYCIVDRPRFSADFMDLEIALLLAGRYISELVRKTAPLAAELITPLTAYGPRVLAQLLCVEDELRRDPLSRRAVVYVGRPTDLPDAIEPSVDTAGQMPCTCIWQFLVREETLTGEFMRSDGTTADKYVRKVLHMIVYMRSWDAVWGLSYDVPCFVAVQQTLAQALDIDVGSYLHHAGSLHIYETHAEMVASALPCHERLTLKHLQHDVMSTSIAYSDALDKMLDEAAVKKANGT